MAADKATHRLNHHNVPGRLKTPLIVFGLIVAATVVVFVAEDVSRPLHAVAAPPAQSFAMSSTNKTMAPDQRLSADDFLARDLSDKISSPVSGPRECRPDLGINNECTFQ